MLPEIVERYIGDLNRQDTPFRLEIVQIFRYDILSGNGFKVVESLTEHPCSYQFGSIVAEEENQIRICPSLRDK